MAIWSKVKKNELEGAMRFDAEYYQPDSIRKAALIRSKPHKTLADISRSVVNFGAYALCNQIEYKDSGVPYLYVGNIKEGYIDDSEVKLIDEGIHDTVLTKSQVGEGQVLLTIAGTIGNAAVAHHVPSKINSNQAIAKITLREGYSPYYVVAFLNSDLGRFQTRRLVVSNVQPNLLLVQVKSLLIPDMPWNFQQAVEKKYEQALFLREKSSNLYACAERMLLDELGLGDLDLSPTLFYERSYSEARAAARLDAEFYQPKYQRVLRSLKRTKPERIAPLGDYISFLTNGHTPLHHDLAEGEVPFLTAEHVFDFRIEYDSDKRILAEHHNGELKRTQLRKGDCVITIKGRIGNAAIAEDIPGETNINQDVALFRLTEELPPYYLLAYLNSLVGKAFSEQYCTGQINPFLGLGNLRLLPIAIYSPKRMESIAAKTREVIVSARSARDESRRLLEEAKRMVEEAVLGE